MKEALHSEFPAFVGISTELLTDPLVTRTLAKILTAIIQCVWKNASMLLIQLTKGNHCHNGSDSCLGTALHLLELITGPVRDPHKDCMDQIPIKTMPGIPCVFIGYAGQKLHSTAAIVHGMRPPLSRRYAMTWPQLGHKVFARRTQHIRFQTQVTTCPPSTFQLHAQL